MSRRSDRLKMSPIRADYAVQRKVLVAVDRVFRETYNQTTLPEIRSIMSLSDVALDSDEEMALEQP